MCRQFCVSGRVQGVFFRESTRTFASTVNLNGHAFNRADGSVEVRACGDLKGVYELERWLQEGPPLANVREVSEELVECTTPTEFTTS